MEIFNTTKPKFCPTCHRPVEKPEMLKNSNIQAKNGVKVQCPHCKKGKVKFI
jgi:endogenous inhibitor of DNA gyrase (YacG/DUF329 family)